MERGLQFSGWFPSWGSYHSHPESDPRASPPESLIQWVQSEPQNLYFFLFFCGSED